MDREHTRYRKFRQVEQGQLVLSELAVRFWAHKKRFCDWNVVPIYHTKPRHWAIEQALIIAAQQIFAPRKGIVNRQPISNANTRQFGIQSLWRGYRYKRTPSSLKLLLSSPLFSSRVHTWSILQDLGSNTQRRFQQSKYIRSLAFSLSGCYALRKLAIHLREPHRTLALSAIDSAIKFRQGRSPWLHASQLDKHLRKMLLTWFFHVKASQTAFHELSFKIVYVKHPALRLVQPQSSHPRLVR